MSRTDVTSAVVPEITQDTMILPVINERTNKKMIIPHVYILDRYFIYILI